MHIYKHIQSHICEMIRRLSLSSIHTNHLKTLASYLATMDLASKLLINSFVTVALLVTSTHGAGGNGSGNIQLILVNNCAESIWPGLLGTAGHPTPQSGGFHLAPGDEAAFDVPVGWSGRVWPRRGCSFDDRGRGLCATGDCGGVLRCDGRPGATPATVVEMTLGTPKSPLHFYDVSLVDGFNAPVSMAPVGGGAGCGVAGCQADLNVCCPSALEVRDREGRVAGCRSACRAMGGDRYCCTGDYASPDKCRPTIFAHVFKAVCPKAYSYAYDDATSLNRCKASRYLITFCPPPTSRK